MLNVTVHDKTNHTVHKTIAVLIEATVTKNGLWTAVENLKSLTRIVMDPPPLPGDTGKNTSRLSIPLSALSA